MYIELFLRNYRRWFCSNLVKSLQNTKVKFYFYSMLRTMFSFFKQTSREMINMFLLVEIVVQVWHEAGTMAYYLSLRSNNRRKFYNVMFNILKNLSNSQLSLIFLQLLCVFGVGRMKKCGIMLPNHPCHLFNWLKNQFLTSSKFVFLGAMLMHAANILLSGRNLFMVVVNAMLMQH